MCQCAVFLFNPKCLILTLEMNKYRRLLFKHNIICYGVVSRQCPFLKSGLEPLHSVFALHPSQNEMLIFIARLLYSYIMKMFFK